MHILHFLHQYRQKTMERNIILKTVDEIILFTNRVKREIAWNEKQTFLILSNTPLFELKKIENYLFENTLNELSKVKILNACNNFIQLDNEYQKIKETEIFYDYNFENIENDYCFKGTGCNKLVYFFYSENSLLKIDKEKFNELFKKGYEFEHLTQFQILNYCKNIIALISPEAPQLLKNSYNKIFSNDIGFTIFTEMFKCYKDEKNQLANFSFVFQSLHKDKLICCSQTSFIHFLENEPYNIFIDKIDSRQYGTNKKTNLYNAIKTKFI